MRIISQDKTVDAPYKEMMLYYAIDSHKHLILARRDSDLRASMGMYSTKKRCIEVMQDIQRKYSCGAKICELPEK